MSFLPETVQKTHRIERRIMPKILDLTAGRNL
jgi:hypothetical protein